MFSQQLGDLSLALSMFCTHEPVRVNLNESNFLAECEGYQLVREAAAECGLSSPRRSVEESKPVQGGGLKW